MTYQQALNLAIARAMTCVRLTGNDHARKALGALNTARKQARRGRLASSRRCVSIALRHMKTATGNDAHNMKGQ
jgi:hypothetical protein